MSWTTTDLSLSKDNIIDINKIETQDNRVIYEQNELKRHTQLQKLQDSQRNEKRQAYVTIMSQFGDLLCNSNKEEIINSLLTDDCEVFLFNFADIAPVQYSFGHEGFTKLFVDKIVLRREVKEAYVSLKKTTGFQICNCEILDQSKGSTISQFSFETFSFRENKISKYRASYGVMPTNYNPESIFKPTKQEKMLAKVKELNYAWADQPDFEKIASLLPVGAEYKFYRWKDNKCFSFDKHNLVSEFRTSLEEGFVITSVVPFESSSEAQFIMGSSVFFLEGKNDLYGQRFIWVSTSVFSFDQNQNIKKISQQGDLYPEDEMLIPFQVHSPAKLRDRLIEYAKASTKIKDEITMFSASDRFHFSFQINSFGCPDTLFTGQIKGFSQCDELNKAIFDKDKTLEKLTRVDIFQDIDDPCYDSIILIDSNKGMINKESSPYCGKEINFYSISKISFENGKLAKQTSFYCVIPDPIPSPFDDVSFIDVNIRPKSEFL